MTYKEKVLFEETQRNVVLIVIPVIFAIFFVAMAGVQIGLRKPLGNHPASNTTLLVIAVIAVIAAALLGTQKLKLKITAKSIYFSFGFFTSPKTIGFTDVKDVSIRQYDALKEFLGWGVRYNANTDCFTVSGDMGLEITLINGKKILIGTQRENDLRMVLQDVWFEKTYLSNS